MSRAAGRPIRVLIVDDEYPARAEMRYHCSRYPDVEVIGEAATAREALRLIEGLEYDVVFLDIAMPGLSGIELAQKLRERRGPPAVVFVSAYDEFAVKAFETRALDYLLKPLDPVRVGEALDRVRERSLPDGAEARSRPAPAGGDAGRASGPAGGSDPAATGGPGGRTAGGGSTPHARWVLGVIDDATIPIPVDDIIYITSERDQVLVYTRQRQYPTRQPLRELEQVLPPDRFFRCHRGYIVNLAQVRAISPFANGTYLLTVRQGGRSTTIPVSRSRVPEMKRHFWPAG